MKTWSYFRAIPKENPPPLISESKKGKRGRPRKSKAKTSQGADAFCRNRGYISTIMKNAMSVIDSLYAALKGEPPIPEWLLFLAGCWIVTKNHKF